MAVERHIVGLGGGAEPEQWERMRRFVLGLTRKDRPRMLYVPTAVGDSDSAIASVFESWLPLAEVSVLRTFPWPPADVRDVILSQDAINVSGGNTANLIAIWKAHGIDVLMREAWERGVLLFGASAGMICWFEHGVTDSFGPQLEGMGCLGFLGGSACPHYDGEERRRPRYRELVVGGFPEGVAADDGVGLHYVGTELREVVTCRPGATAYRVTRDGEKRLDARELT